MECFNSEIRQRHIFLSYENIHQNITSHSKTLNDSICKRTILVEPFYSIDTHVNKIIIHSYHSKFYHVIM